MGECDESSVHLLLDSMISHICSEYVHSINYILVHLNLNMSSMQKAPETVNFDVSEPVVILGFGQMGQVH